MSFGDYLIIVPAIALELMNIPNLPFGFDTKLKALIDKRKALSMGRVRV